MCHAIDACLRLAVPYLISPNDHNAQWTNVTRFVRIIRTNIRQIIRTDIRLGNWPLFV